MLIIGTRSIVSKREFYEEFGLPEKMMDISYLVDSIIEQKIMTAGVDKVNPKLLMKEVRSQISNILENEGLLSALEKDNPISMSKSFQSLGGLASRKCIELCLINCAQLQQQIKSQLVLFGICLLNGRREPKGQDRDKKERNPATKVRVICMNQLKKVDRRMKLSRVRRRSLTRIYANTEVRN